MAAGQSSSGQPKEQEQKRGPTEGERTPESPQGQEPEQKPGGDQPEQPQPDGQKPDERGENPPSGRNQPDSPRVDEGGPAVNPTEDAERWGMLPERVRQIFRNQITDDLPVQYRDWIDSYYRRMNRTR